MEVGLQGEEADFVSSNAGKMFYIGGIFQNEKRGGKYSIKGQQVVF